MTIRCEIVSQDKIVFQGDVDIVVIPGSSGEMGVLEKHAPLLSSLQFGIITIRLNGKEEHFTVAGGVAEIEPDQVTILADSAENVEEISLQRAEESRQRAEEMISNGSLSNADEYLALQAALRRSKLRIDAVKRYRTGKWK
jgi:F-type H+-transporting ATPase subunit epsilon